jgi:hypothetical protein
MDDGERVKMNAAARLITERYSAVEADQRFCERGQWSPEKAVYVLDEAVLRAEYAPDSVPRDAALAGLTLISWARRDLRGAELSFIEHARRIGITWEDIGTALGSAVDGPVEAYCERLRDDFEAYLKSAGCL